MLGAAGVQAPSGLTLAQLRLTSYNKDVYGPSDDSFALADALVQECAAWATLQPSFCLELGSGSGYVVCSAARILSALHLTCAVLAIDISDAATKATGATLGAHGLAKGHVDILQMDLCTALLPRLRHSVDLLLFNPPYVVTPDEEVDRGGIASAWAGGAHGRRVIDRLLAVLDELLSSTGLLYMVTVAENHPAELLQEVHVKYGLHGRVVLQRRADEELLFVLVIGRAAAVQRDLRKDTCGAA
jgi:release factor glutamine methyltransferase